MNNFMPSCDNRNEMDKFLERLNVLKLTEEEINDINSIISV